MANDKNNVEDTLKNVISKSAEVSKDVFSKAGDAVQNFSDKSVLKFEIKQLDSKRNKMYTELGKIISELYNTKDFDIKNTAAFSENEIIAEKLTSAVELQNQIKETSELISDKEKQLQEKNKKKVKKSEKK
ncbi:MAG: hypothetical protein K5829_13800 [Treponema sp.]|nr:hypothetical protein [Treponema sp.]